MSDDLPEPLTSADCDMRGMPYMPADTTRALDSDTFAISNGDEFKAHWALIFKSWSQVPAASLPNDDRILAHLSGAGSSWKKVRAVALRGWVLCSDNRLYHPVVAEKALHALPMRRDYQEKRSGDAERKARERDDRREMFAQLRSLGITPAWDAKTADLRALVTRHVTDPVTGHVTKPVTEPVTQTVTPVTVKRGKGRGKGTGKEGTVPSAPALHDDEADDDARRRARAQALQSAIDRVCERAGVANSSRRARDRNLTEIEGWLAEGLSFEDHIVPAIEATMARVTEPVTSLAYFSREVRAYAARARPQGGRTRDHDPSDAELGPDGDDYGLNGRQPRWHSHEEDDR